MQIDWWTLGLQTVNVLVLVWILSRFLFRPVAAMVAARQEEARHRLDDAARERAAAQAERAKAKAETEQMAAMRVQALATATAAAEEEKAAILARASAEAAKLRTAAEGEIAHLREAEAAQVADRAGRLAVDIAARLLANLPQDIRITGFVDGLVQAVATLPPATRAEIGAAGPVRIKAARQPTDAETEACRAKLAEALGRDVEVVFDADPELVAGLEIETDHALVRSSLRADLDRIAAELTHPAGSP